MQLVCMMGHAGSYGLALYHTNSLTQTLCCAIARTPLQIRSGTHTMQCLLKEVDGVKAVEHAEGACYYHGEVGEQQHLRG